MTAASKTSAPVKQSRFMRRALPYLLSLPALLICIGILIPFFIAVCYSLLRYRMNLPQMKNFIWFDNYINFFTDPKFWNTIYISLTYAALTAAQGLAATVMAVTPLNERTVLLLQSDGGWEFLASLPSSATTVPEPGTKLHASFAASETHLFDGQTGERLHG